MPEEKICRCERGERTKERDNGKECWLCQGTIKYKPKGIDNDKRRDE
jgi:hypothetical protein